MRVFQSVSFSLKRHVVSPPFEMLDQGRLVPGKLATVHPWRTGTAQLCLASPLTMPKLQDDSVVAVEPFNGKTDFRSRRKKISKPAVTANPAPSVDEDRMFMSAPKKNHPSILNRHN
jgi:hypothetical protein